MSILDQHRTQCTSALLDRRQAQLSNSEDQFTEE